MRAAAAAVQGLAAGGGVPEEGPRRCHVPVRRFRGGCGFRGSRRPVRVPPAAACRAPPLQIHHELDVTQLLLYTSHLDSSKQ